MNNVTKIFVPPAGVSFRISAKRGQNLLEFRTGKKSRNLQMWSTKFEICVNDNDYAMVIVTDSSHYTLQGGTTF